MVFSYVAEINIFLVAHHFQKKSVIRGQVTKDRSSTWSKIIRANVVV